MALGDPARAERAFAEAVRIRPGWADAWVNFGLARYRQAAIEDAKRAMQEALRRQPGHAAATANLGAFLRLTGEAAAAESLLLGAIAAEPRHAGARLNLVDDLLLEERPTDALALLDAASMPTDPATQLHWKLAQALALLQSRRNDEARALLDQVGAVPPALVPLLRWRRLLLAVNQGRGSDARDEAAAMELALAAMGPDAVPEHRIMGHFDLAKFWSGVGQYARAFGHWRAGHALLAPLQPFSRDQALAFIEASIARFDRPMIEARRAANRDRAPVFIVGMPRSGTTLCEQILAAHGQVHGAGERTALGQCVRRLSSGGTDAVERIASLEHATLDAAAESYLAELKALAPGKALIVDKMPGNALHLGLVGLMLPGARIIHCVRDPRDIGLSIFTFRFHGSHGYAHDLGDLGWTIAQTDRLMAHWRAVLPNPILTVRLSDWVEDFEGTLARLLRHLELPPDPRCARFHEADRRVRTASRAQVRAPVNARGLGRWRAYEAELAPLIAELEAGGALASWRDGG